VIGNYNFSNVIVNISLYVRICFVTVLRVSLSVPVNRKCRGRLLYSVLLFYIGIISKFKITNLHLCRLEASSFVACLPVTISQIRREMTCILNSLTLLREWTRYGAFVKVMIVL